MDLAMRPICEQLARLAVTFIASVVLAAQVMYRRFRRCSDIPEHVIELSPQHLCVVVSVRIILYSCIHLH